MSVNEEATPRPGIFEKIAPILVVLSIGLAFMVGVLWQKVNNLEKGGTTAATNTEGQPNQPAVSLDTIKGLFDKNLVKFGGKDRKVLFVEVADPSCPYCHVATGLNSALNNQMGGQFKLVKDGGKYIAPVAEMRKLVDSGKASYVWIYTPGHGNGEMGSKALYCAQDVGKFWEVHDLLYTNAGYDFMNTTVKNDKTKSEEVASFLKSATDPAEMKKCLDSGKYDSRLTEETDIARSIGISGTPGFFINATSYAGAYSWTDMKSTVDAALK
ncbi:MAG: DsbA family protein [Candidatus Woesebacteria bacterium]|nr:MAG: DsbA family protein [Candidatus Woesebacteria bacterium]